MIEDQSEYSRLCMRRMDHISDIINRIMTRYGIQRVQWDEHQTSPDSVDSGEFEYSVVLRPDDDEGDDMGRDYDPDAPGVAELWFRQFRGDE